jgi:hypothetical protein
MPMSPEKRREKLARKLAKHGIAEADINAATLQLIDRLPAAFDPKARKPLAIGIHQQILAELGCNEFALSMALGRWCNHRRTGRAQGLP